MADLTPLRTRTNEAEFSVFLVEIADQITKEEVDEMKYLCTLLPRGRLDEIKEPREFVNLGPDALVKFLFILRKIWS